MKGEEPNHEAVTALLSRRGKYKPKGDDKIGVHGYYNDAYSRFRRLRWPDKGIMSHTARLDIYLKSWFAVGRVSYAGGQRTKEEHYENDRRVSPHQHLSQRNTWVNLPHRVNSHRRLQSKTSIDTHTITWTKGGDRRGAQGGHMTSNDVVCSHVPHWWWCSGLDVTSIDVCNM